jgi:GTPase
VQEELGQLLAAREVVHLRQEAVAVVVVAHLPGMVEIVKLQLVPEEAEEGVLLGMDKVLPLDQRPNLVVLVVLVPEV